MHRTARKGGRQPGPDPSVGSRRAREISMGETRPVVAEDYVPEVREPAGYRRSDADIASELREHLADDVGLDACGIDIEAKDGEVTMRGAVRHCGDVKRAEAHACA